MGNPEPMRKYASKIPEVIELRQQEKSWSAIGRQLDIPRRSLYNLRNSEGFMMVANDMWLDLMDDMQKQREEGSAYTLNESIRNQIRIFTLLSGTNMDNLSAPKSLDPSPEICEACILSKRKDVTKLVEKILALIPIKKHKAFAELLETHAVSDTPRTRTLERMKEQ